MFTSTFTKLQQAVSSIFGRKAKPEAAVTDFLTNTNNPFTMSSNGENPFTPRMMEQIAEHFASKQTSQSIGSELATGDGMKLVDALRKNS